MQARLLRGLLILLLLVSVGWAGPGLLPHTAQASQPQAARSADTVPPAATDTATVVDTATQPAATGTVTPGPTTAPPLLQITSSFTAPSDVSSVVVTLHITNVSTQATPADSTLVINLPSDFALVSSSGGVVTGGTLIVAIGALA